MLYDHAKAALRAGAKLRLLRGGEFLGLWILGTSYDGDSLLFFSPISITGFHCKS